MVDITRFYFFQSLCLLGMIWNIDQGRVEAVDFDHFILVFQWPVTFCENKLCRKPLPGYWTIHGFWPSKSDGSPVDNCSNIPFKEKLIPLETRNHMNRVWPDLLSRTGNSSKFWAQQWKKHGTCANVSGTRTVAEYFNTTIQLASNYNISHILQNSQINPGKSFQMQEIEDAIENGTSHLPYIKMWKKRTLWLWEIRTCFNKTFHGIDCHKKNIYHGNVLYPRHHTSGRSNVMPPNGQRRSSVPLVSLLSVIITIPIFFT
ncbi:ribonuclease Oy-like isoform X2 [Ostrea edulis]|nr:ribonuclease Oy-like isoform X2 [Ostrea edulis]